MTALPPRLAVLGPLSHPPAAGWIAALGPLVRAAEGWHTADGDLVVALDDLGRGRHLGRVLTCGLPVAHPPVRWWGETEGGQVVLRLGSPRTRRLAATDRADALALLGAVHAASPRAGHPAERWLATRTAPACGDRFCLGLGLLPDPAEGWIVDSADRVVGHTAWQEAGWADPEVDLAGLARALGLPRSAVPPDPLDPRTPLPDVDAVLEGLTGPGAFPGARVESLRALEPGRWRARLDGAPVQVVVPDPAPTPTELALPSELQRHLGGRGIEVEVPEPLRSGGVAFRAGGRPALVVVDRSLRAPAAADLEAHAAAVCALHGLPPEVRVPGEGVVGHPDVARPHLGWWAQKACFVLRPTGLRRDLRARELARDACALGAADDLDPALMVRFLVAVHRRLPLDPATREAWPGAVVDVLRQAGSGWAEEVARNVGGLAEALRRHLREPPHAR